MWRCVCALCLLAGLLTRPLSADDPPSPPIPQQTVPKLPIPQQPRPAQSPPAPAPPGQGAPPTANNTNNTNSPILQSSFEAWRPQPVAQVFAPPPDKPVVNVTGFFQLDAGWFHQSPANRVAVGDVQDGMDFRRARLAATGDVGDGIAYMIEFDFAFPGRPTFMDVWLELQDVWDAGRIRVGQFRQPISMSGMTSVRELLFVERALPFALIPFRQVGAMAYGTTSDESRTWAVSTFRFPTDAFASNVGDSGGYGLATRITGLAVDEGDDLLVHLGGGFSFADPANDLVQYRNQPEFFVGETGGAALIPAGVPTSVPSFVDTGAIPTQNYRLYGAEAAARIHSLYVQSEFLMAVVDRLGADTAGFPGVYVQAAYLLTGEVRPYNKSGGVFGRVVPREPFNRAGGRGAWEVAARWSYLDLDDADIHGGRIHDLTGGLNWYLNRYTKVQFNYIHAFLSSPINGDSDADIVAVRAQLDF